MKPSTLVRGTYHGIPYTGTIWGSFEAFGESIYFIRLFEPIEINGQERMEISIVDGCDEIEPLIQDIPESQWQVDIPDYQTGDEADEWSWTFETQEQAIAAAIREHGFTGETIKVSEII